MAEHKLSSKDLQRLRANVDRVLEDNTHRSLTEALAAVAAAMSPDITSGLPAWGKASDESPDSPRHLQFPKRKRIHRSKRDVTELDPLPKAPLDVRVAFARLKVADGTKFASFTDYARAYALPLVNGAPVVFETSDTVLLEPDSSDYRYASELLDVVKERGEKSGLYPNQLFLRSLIFDSKPSNALCSSIELTYYYQLTNYLNDEQGTGEKLPPKRERQSLAHQTTTIGATVDAAVVALIDQATEDSNLSSRSAWIAAAIRDKLEQQGYDPSREAQSENYEKTAPSERKSSRPRRLPRKREEFNDPSKPSNAQVNLSTTPMMVRMGGQFRTAIDRVVKSEGATRNDWLLSAVKDALRLEVNLNDYAGERVKLDKMVTVRLSPSDKEQIAEAAERAGLSSSDLVRFAANWRLADPDI